MKPFSFSRSHYEFSAERRMVGILAVMIVACVGVLVQLFSRSVLQSGLAETKAQAQQEVTVKLNPFRGMIYVHGEGDNTIALALNEPRAAVAVVPRNVKDKILTAKKLAPLINTTEKELFEKINNDKPYIPPVARSLPLTVGHQIEDLALPGVSISTESYRTYPEGSLAAQVLGFVNAEGNGQYGVEGYYDSQLQGFAGNVKGERDGWGNTYIDSTTATNNKGADVVLTIDRDVQATVEQMLQAAMDKFKAKSGSVIIVDPKTGKIIALANAPSFDPNAFNQVKADEQSRFQNISISRAFEPGSVMKSITIAAALDSGRVKQDDQGNYGASVKVDDYDIHTAENKAYGHESVTDVLVNSDNVAMVDISGKLGRELFDDYLNRFNFGKKSGIDMDTEGSGNKPPLRSWRAVNTATISFGQGITTTPLQMVMAYAAIANKGIYMKPHVVDEVILPDGKKETIEPKQLGRAVGEQAARDVSDMLVQVVVRGHGKRAGVAGYTVAGKTGTAQIPNVDGPGYQEGKNNGSFAGFAPAEDPKFAMFVTLEEPTGVEFAESSAAPLWGEIAKYLLKNHFHVTPNQ